MPLVVAKKTLTFVKSRTSTAFPVVTIHIALIPIKTPTQSSTATTTAGTLGVIRWALYGMMTSYVAPNNFTVADSLILVSIVILGGIGNPWGIIPAAAIVVILPEKLQFIQEYRFLLYAIVVILILLFRPDGLLPRRIREYFPGNKVGGQK